MLTGVPILQKGPPYPWGQEHVNMKPLAKQEPPLIQGLTSHGPEVGAVTGRGVVAGSVVVVNTDVAGSGVGSGDTEGQYYLLDTPFVKNIIFIC